MNSELGYSVFRFVLPFFCESYKGVKEKPFCVPDWKQFSINTKYLTQSVCELFGNEEKAVCQCFSLNDSARMKYCLPTRDSLVTMHSDMPACSGDYHFYLSAHRIIWFESGIGFLAMDVQIPENEIHQATDISFCVSNIFTNEHDNSAKTNNLQFEYSNGETRIAFSIKNSLMQLVFGSGDGNGIKLFPSSPRKRLFVFHSVCLDDSIENPQKVLYCLSNALHSNVKYDSEADNGSIISSFAGQRWYLCTNGVTSLAIVDNDSKEFVITSFRKNVFNDYFYIYMLALHEREMLLEYNSKAVRFRDKPQELLKLKKSLLDMQIMYTFNTISIEPSYQKYYENLENVFNLSKLETDINDVISNVESHINDRKDRKVNTLLTALSILAVFSILTDGIALADRIESGAPFEILQWGVIIAVSVIIAAALVILRRRK